MTSPVLEIECARMFCSGSRDVLRDYARETAACHTPDAWEMEEARKQEINLVWGTLVFPSFFALVEMDPFVPNSTEHGVTFSNPRVPNG
jgi:hypothetical protein